MSEGEEICPKCGNMLIMEPKIGEVICPKCGYVLSRKRVVHTPEWKAIDPEDKLKRSRVGPPITLLKHDLGLSTDIGDKNVDFQGIPLQERENIMRMRMWQNRLRTSGKEKSIASLLSKVNEFSTILHLPQTVAETASYIIWRAVKKGLTTKRSTSGLAAAAVYMACRKCDINRSMKEIAKAAGIRAKTLGTYYRYLVREIGGVKIPLTPLEKHITKISNKLKISTKVTRLAVTMAKSMKDPDLISGRQPSGLAAAFIYIAASFYDEPILQKEIASVAGVTEVTIRKRCREILESYNISIKLR